MFPARLNWETFASATMPSLARPLKGFLFAIVALQVAKKIASRSMALSFDLDLSSTLICHEKGVSVFAENTLQTGAV